MGKARRLTGGILGSVVLLREFSVTMKALQLTITGQMVTSARTSKMSYKDPKPQSQKEMNMNLQEAE